MYVVTSQFDVGLTSRTFPSPVNFTIDNTASLHLITIATHPNPPTTTATMTTGLIPNWYPPTRENYDLILSLWKWFPAVRPPFPPLSHPPN